jgi:hypothetical protein
MTKLDRRTAVVDAEPASGEGLVLPRVEIGEALAELDSAAIDVIDRNVALPPASGT